MPVPAMTAAMHEDMHQRAGEQQQIGQSSPEMRLMLEHQIEPGDSGKAAEDVEADPASTIRVLHRLSLPSQNLLRSPGDARNRGLACGPKIDAADCADASAL